MCFPQWPHNFVGRKLVIRDHNATSKQAVDVKLWLVHASICQVLKAYHFPFPSIGALQKHNQVNKFVLSFFLIGNTHPRTKSQLIPGVHRPPAKSFQIIQEGILPTLQIICIQEHSNLKHEGSIPQKPRCLPLESTQIYQMRSSLNYPKRENHVIDTYWFHKNDAKAH